MNYFNALIICLFSFLSLGQEYGNEWINYSQNYYRFQITATGIHRINYDDLQAAGIPVASFSHENIQVFGRRQEVPIWIELNGDGTFNTGDYILFYAEKNDGWIDSSLYVDPNSLSNPAYNLYNDTINYFFTWNNLTTNLRYTDPTDSDFSSYTPAAFAWQKFTTEYHNTYLQGERIESTSSSFYVHGEGYGGAAVESTSGYTYNLSAYTTNPYTGGPDSKFIGLATSLNDSPPPTGTNNHHSQWEINGQLIDDHLFTGYKQYRLETTFPSALLTNITPVKYKIIGDLGVYKDIQSLTYWRIEYPRLFDFAGASSINITVENSFESKLRIDLSNISSVNPIAFAIGTNSKLQLINEGGVLKSLIDNAPSGSQQIVLGDLDNCITVGSFERVTESGKFTNYSSFNLERALLMVYPNGLYDAAFSYFEYRSELVDGNYNALLVNSEELYDQFGGGVNKHISGIRNFSWYVYDNSTQKPVGLFLIGKGISNDLTRTNPTNFNNSLIPTFGYPSSDALITANLPGTTKWRPLIPTGRISITNEEQLINYLNKVKEFETNQDPFSVYDSPSKDWQKHAIHMVGGADHSQQILFQSWMNNLKTKLEHEQFGASVTTIARDSDDPIDPASLSDIMSRIENGVSLITYLGHSGISATESFEINLDDVENWNNEGKYPIMIVNSCYNGNIFSAGNSSSQYYVNAINAGAVGYFASTHTGFANHLYQYNLKLYNNFGNTLYNQSFGKNIQESIGEMETSFSGLMPVTSMLYYESTATQMVLNGDPMLKINSHDEPEIELLESNVSILTENIDLSTDSLELQIILKNLGRSIVDTFDLEITRNFPGSDIDSIYHIAIPELHYTDTIRLKMPMEAGISIGINEFSIKADIPNFIPEQYDEYGNNEIVFNYYLNVDAILPVLPYKFAVVPENLVTVKASTLNPIAEMNTYLFELDTTDLFNSPFLRRASVTELGGVKEVGPNDWDTPLVLEDSVVYFWRVAVDADEPIWSERSFQYIPGKEGWGQDHFFQFKANNFNNINYNRANRLREWDPDSILVTCDAYSNTGFSNAWHLNGTLQDYALCTTTPSIHVAVFDPLTFEPWQTNNDGSYPEMSFGNVNDGTGCRSRREKYFIFRETTLAQLEAFQNMVLNEVPDGHYMLIYSPYTTRFDLWNALDSIDMYATFATLGSTEIVPGLDNAPFTFFCRKGYPTSVEEDLASNPAGPTGSGNGTTSAHINTYAYGSSTYGIETSPFIGPAAAWHTIYWKQDSIDPINNADTTRLYIQYFDENKVLSGAEDLLFSSHDSLLNVGSLIDAATYPYMKLQAYYKDTTNFTPAQVDHWHVLYQPLPEAAIDGTEAYYWSQPSDTLFEGQEVSFAVDVKNIFNIDMDSILITYWIEDESHNLHYIDYPRQDSLKVGQTIRDTIHFSTLGFGGINSLWMEVNPYVNGSLIETDQPEQEHFNNVLQLPFYVIEDNINPLLDVSFDGIHILNGDIVSPFSEILITLKDENEYLIMDDVSDTSRFGVYIIDPDGIQTRIPFIDASGNTIMQWIPAEPTNKRFKIIFPANFEKDGTYELLVQGSDRSGNLSGDLQYRVEFEVVRESTITHMMNYPNPFSTSTRFVFTLTGSEVPDEIIIQIMTVSGRVVREITEDQLGPIRIGRNITEYAWDGTDEFGDPLANGVYLYRVKAQIHGEDIEHRDSGADQYFKKEFGKMYLMR